MAQGVPSPAAAKDPNHLSRALFDGRPQELKDVALYEHALRLLTVIKDNRNERVHSSNGSVPIMLWLVMLAGALVTLGYPSFFATPSLTAQVLMTAALAIGADLVRGLVLDYWFTGQVHISPAPFDQALQEMNQSPLALSAGGARRGGSPPAEAAGSYRT
jgi:hypothetical protein